MDEGDGAREAWQRFLDHRGRLEELDGASYRLLPQLYRNLDARWIRADEMLKLWGAYRDARRRNELLLDAAGASAQDLQAAEVSVMALKGAAVAPLYPGGLGTRPMVDVDLLVKPADVDRAVAVLRSHGFEEGGATPLPLALRARHALAFRRVDGLAIDLHWHFLAEFGDDRAVWARACHSTLGGTTILVPSPADQLLGTCVHGLGFSPAPVRWITDGVSILRGDAEIDWGVLVDEARKRDVTVVVADALRFLVEGIGERVPPAVIEALTCSPASLTAQLAHRVASGRSSVPWEVGFFLAHWDLYRRRESMHARRSWPSGYPSFLADKWGLPTRRALVALVLRKATKRLARERWKPSPVPATKSPAAHASR